MTYSFSRRFSFSLFQHAAACIADLNARHPRIAQAPRFLLLHRRRSHSAGERRWIGWERKRGKLPDVLGTAMMGEIRAALRQDPDDLE